MVLFRFTGWLKQPISWLVIVLSVIVVWNIEVYFQTGVNARFLFEKGELVKQPWWLTAFYFHIVGAGLCLLVGLPLMFKGMLRFKRTHHSLGYVYFNAVLWIAAPAGLVISPVAKGGWFSALGFVLTGLLWWWVTWQGYVTIRRKEVAAHIRWMIRSYAIALSAVFFRVIQLGLVLLLDYDPNTSYIMAVWLSLIASLMLAETAIVFAKPNRFTIPKNSLTAQLQEGAIQ